jgi:glycine/D-amino acid oxidase-like deaminating enzyme
METLPEDFDMSTMRPPRDDYHVALLIDSARRRFPFITPQTPIHITQGIMTMTPDGQPFCGKSPDVDGLYHCAGFCGHGIVQSPVIGRIMAQLIVDGETPYDIGAIEADRFFETSELLDRAEVKQRCYRTYSNYYGQVMKPDVASS